MMAASLSAHAAPLRRSPFWAPLLPVVAAFYMAATHRLGGEPLPGRGVAWKGRAYAVSAVIGVDRRDLVGQGPRRREFPGRLAADPPRSARRTCTPSTPSPATPTTSPTSPALAPEDKVARLDVMEEVLLGRRDAGSPSALGLRASLAETGVTARHSLDLLIAFRRDATKLRYASWDELHDYCRYSAVPVGRHVLDLHGEERATPRRHRTRCAPRCRC